MATIVLKPTNARLYLTDEVSLPWSATNLGEGNFMLQTRRPVYWEAEMRGYDRDTGTLSLQIIDYDAPGEMYRPNRSAKSIVRAVKFAELDRDRFCAQLTYYRVGELPLSKNEATSTGQDFFEPSLPHPPPEQPPKRTPRSYPLEFSVALTELTIHDGYAEGHYRDWMGTIPYRLPNPHLRKEFHPIRGFFARHLRRTTVAVTAELAFNASDEPLIRRAHSLHLSLIDDRLLEVLRARALQHLIRPDETDQRLFTPEDLMANYAEDEPLRALLPTSGEDLLAEILRTQDVRNSAQLAHLAGRHERGQKIRFVLTPKFGFLFFVRGTEMHHFILELLDSHATYVWSLPCDAGTLADHLDLVTREVQHLNAVGRSSYRRANAFPYPFRTVRHESIGSEFVDGFPRWKHRLEEGLV